jgi:hypothetical protein
LGDQIVFGLAGISGRSSPSKTSWDAFNIVRKEFSMLAKHPDDHLIEKLAHVYSKRYTEKINQDMSNPELLSYVMKQGGDAGQAIFAGFNKKHQRVIVEVTAGTRSSTHLIPGNDTVETRVLGDNGIAEEYFTGETARSRDWLKTLKIESEGMGLKDRLTLQAEAIVGLTAKYHPENVGGPIDVVLVTRSGGVEWIRRNEECGGPHKSTK